MNTHRKTKKQNLMVKVVVLLMAVIVVFSAFTPMKASAHSTYLLTVTMNEGDSRYEPLVLYDRAGWGQNHAAHREPKLGYFGKYKYTTTPLPEMGGSSPSTVEKALGKYSDSSYVTGGTGNPHLIYSFPGYHGTKDYDASAKDLQRAEWVSRTMIQSLNDAIGFVTLTADKKPNKYELMFIGTNLANGGYTKGKFEYNGYKVVVTGDVTLTGDALKNKVKGVNKDGYAKVTISKTGTPTVSRYFVSKVPKGYKSNQPLFSSIPDELQKLHNAKGEVHGFSQDVTSLTWKHAVLQAHHSFWENDATFDNFDSIAKPGKAEQYFTEMGENFLLMLRSMLGLYSFSELMLNEGARGGGGYYLGIMPISWMDSASILHWTSMALSWLLIMFAFVKLLALRNLSAINIAKRVDLVDGIKNLIVVGFALMLFNPIFYTLAHFNWLLVDVMKNTSNVTSGFGTTAPGAGLLAKLFISLAYLIVEIYFNFIYISRGIIVAILYGVGPLFVTSLAFGGKYSQIFSNYVKELVGTIYMQTFHAILVAFFATVTIFGGVRLFEQLVVLFAFIPLTKFFREAIGVGGGIADIAGAGAFGAVGDMTKMGTKSMRQNGGSLATSAKNSFASKKSNSSAPMTQMKNSSNFQNGEGGASGAGGGSGSMSQVDNSTVAPNLSITSRGRIVNDKNESVGFNAFGQARKTMSESAVNKPTVAPNLSISPRGRIVNDKDETVGFNAMGQTKSTASETAEIKAIKASESNQSVQGGNAQMKSDAGTMAGVDKPSKGSSIGKVLDAGAGFAGLGGAIGMQAIGQGTVSQNVQAITPKVHKKFATTKKNNMYDPQQAQERAMGKPQGQSQSQNQNQSQPKTKTNANKEAPSQFYDNRGYAGSTLSDDQAQIQHNFRMKEVDGHSGMYDDYAISDVREDKGEMVYEYDYDTNSNSFNGGSHAGAEQAVLMQDMYSTFNPSSSSPQQEARKAEYEKQGITGVKKNANGRIEVSAKKGTGGIHGVGHSGDMYRFNRSNGDNRSVSLLDSIEYAESQNAE